MYMYPYWTMYPLGWDYPAACASVGGGIGGWSLGVGISGGNWGNCGGGVCGGGTLSMGSAGSGGACGSGGCSGSGGGRGRACGEGCGC
jgi:hypothetical protein